MRRLYLIIFFISFGAGLFIFPKNSVATTAPELVHTDSGGKLYTYTTVCSGTGLQAKQGFITPEGVGTIDTFYIHFHDSSNPTPEKLCTLSNGYGLCGAAAILSQDHDIRAAIILSMENKGGSTATDKNLTELQRDCMLNEAKEKIATVVSNQASGQYVISAHGIGTNTAIKFFEQGFSAKQSILFNGCEEGRCEKVASFQDAGKVLIYASNYNGNIEAAAAAYTKFSSKIFALKLPQLNGASGDTKVPSLCYLDHTKGNKCNGNAEPMIIVPSNEYGIGKSCSIDSDCPNNLDCEDSDIEGNDDFCVCRKDTEQCFEAYGEDYPGQSWTCEDGTGITEAHTLHFCKSSQGIVKYPLQSLEKNIGADGSLADDLMRAYTNTPLTESEILALIQKPNPKIRIPGLSFSDLTVNGTLSTDDGGNTYLDVPYLGEYVKAVYNYLILIAGLICVVRIIIGGFIYAVPDSSGEAKSAAIKMILHAIVGLLLAVSSYTILYLFNPELVEFKNLRVMFVHGQPLADYEELPETSEFGFVQDNSVGSQPGASSPVSSAAAKSLGGLLGGPNTLPACTTQTAQAVAQKLHDLKVCVGPCHCAWTATRFSSYIGCGNKTLTGNANTMVSHLETQGWISHEIGSDYASIPLGFLWFPGHAGFSIGEGEVFESTIDQGLQHAAEGGSCPDLYTQITSPTQCDYCAKIPSEGPSTAKYWRKPGKNGKASGCQDNQGWLISGAKRVKEFRLVISPPKAGQTQATLGCCTSEKNKFFVVSKLACEHFNIHSVKRDKAGNVINPRPNLAGRWDTAITDPAQCGAKKK